MATYNHFDHYGLPGEGIDWFDEAGVWQVGYICFAIMDEGRTGEMWRVEVWKVSENLAGVPHNVLLATLPATAWLDPERRLPYIYPRYVDEDQDRQAAEAAYLARVNVLAADIAAHAGDMTLMTLLADGMPVSMALEAVRLLAE